MMDVLGKGSYGEVKINSTGDAIKSTRMFHKHSLSNNFSEAVFAATAMSRPLENVVSISAVTAREDMFEICMEKGLMTLWDYSHHLTWTERNAVIHDIIKDVCIALLHLHRMGIVHCDLKPSNIILVENGLRLIDFGSARFWDRPTAPNNSKRYAWGTHAFCAPEVLATGLHPTPACDAYSLGATVYAFLMRKALFKHDKKMDAATLYKTVLDMHGRKGGIVSLSEPPDGMSSHTFRLLTGLLHPDPVQRISVWVLSGSYNIQLPRHVPMLILDGFDLPSVQSKLIIFITYKECIKRESEAAFPLATSIALRYASVTKLLQPCPGKIKACIAIAVAIINPDCGTRWCADDLSVIVVIMTSLDHRLYSDTCDCLLRSVHEQPNIDMPTLYRSLLHCEGRTVDTVDMYMRFCGSHCDADRLRWHEEDYGITPMAAKIKVQRHYRKTRKAKHLNISVPQKRRKIKRANN